MSKILCFLAFILWIMATLFLVISIVGYFVVLGCEDEWFGIGQELVQGFKGGEQ